MFSKLKNKVLHSYILQESSRVETIILYYAHYYCNNIIYFGHTLSSGAGPGFGPPEKADPRPRKSTPYTKINFISQTHF